MKYVLFDAYGTLFNAGKENIIEIASQIGDKYCIDSKNFYEDWSQNYFTLEKKFDIQFMTIIMANRISLSYSFGKFGLPLNDIELWISKIIHMWSDVSCYHGAHQLISKIIEQDVKVGIISNTDEETLIQAINNTKLPITYFLSSERAKCYKPSSKIFKIALNELRINETECVYIGNSVSDIVGAHNAGIRTIFFNHEHHILPKNLFTTEVEELNQIIPILINNEF